MTEPSPGPCPNAVDVTEWKRPDGMPFTGFNMRTLTCPTSGKVLAATYHYYETPPVPQWFGLCGCLEPKPSGYATTLTNPIRVTFTKDPNPSPLDTRKKAQDLMNAAENAPLGVHVLSPADALSEIIAAQIDFAHILIPKPKLAVDLPKLPAGTVVEFDGLTVRRGRSYARIMEFTSDFDPRGWGLQMVHHEGTPRPGEPGYTEQGAPFLADARSARFDNPTDAIALANTLLDALDEWYSALAQARTRSEQLLEHITAGLTPAEGLT